MLVQLPIQTFPCFHIYHMRDDLYSAFKSKLISTVFPTGPECSIRSCSWCLCCYLQLHTHTHIHTNHTPPYIIPGQHWSSAAMHLLLLNIATWLWWCSGDCWENSKPPLSPALHLSMAQLAPINWEWIHDAWSSLAGALQTPPKLPPFSPLMTMNGVIATGQMCSVCEETRSEKMSRGKVHHYHCGKQSLAKPKQNTSSTMMTTTFLKVGCSVCLWPFSRHWNLFICSSRQKCVPESDAIFCHFVLLLACLHQVDVCCSEQNKSTIIR